MSSKLTAAHTPGPYLREGTTVYALDARGLVNRMSASVQGGFVERDNRYGGERTSDEERQATAALFAAAPDMLEALREAEGELYQVPPADAEQERVLGIVRAAIAKATGRLALKEAGDGQG